MTFTPTQSHEMSSLKEMKLWECEGNIGIASLFSRSTNVTKLMLKAMDIDAATAKGLGDLKNLEYLEWRRPPPPYCSW